jgi:hypothetical protein
MDEQSPAQIELRIQRLKRLISRYTPTSIYKESSGVVVDNETASKSWSEVNQRLRIVEKIPALNLAQSLQRLENLRLHFLHIGSVDELKDAVVEGGTILAQIVYHRLGNYSSILPAGSIEPALEFMAGHCLAYIAQSGTVCGLPIELEDLPFNETFRKGYREQFWITISEGSDQSRSVLSKSIGTSEFHFRGDFKQQGKRYSLLVSELIAKLSTEQPNGSPDARGKQGYSTSELAIVIAGVISDGSPDWTAMAVADEINRKCPDRTVGSTKVGKHPVFTDYKARFGRRRNRNTGKPKTITTSGDILDNLANQTRRKTKPLNPDDRDDGY